MQKQIPILIKLDINKRDYINYYNNIKENSNIDETVCIDKGVINNFNKE